MKFVKNFFCKFMAGFYMDMRDLHQSNYINDDIKALKYHLRMQKWENKIIE